MDLSYTEFQQLLRSTARDFAERQFPIDRHRELVEQGQSFDPEAWKAMAELGWFGLVVDPRHGGNGGGWLDLTVLLEEMGRALMPLHFLAQTLAATIIEEFGTQAQQDELLPAIGSGELIYAVALTEPSGSYEESGIECRAERAGDGFRLSGTKQYVRGGASADRLIVLTRLEDGAGLFVVDAQAAGLTTRALDNIGDDDQARIELSAVEVSAGSLLGDEAQGWDALPRLVELGALMECGYGVGVMSRDTEITINYVRDRVQFGRPLGSFQAVQHQVADQVTALECARYLTLYAAWAMDEGLPSASVDIARAKAMTSESLRTVARTGNQLHGGIGFTKEYDLHFYYQRAKTCELMFGNAILHHERVAAAVLDH